MATTTRRIVIVALAIAAMTACTSHAQAQIRFRFRRPIRMVPVMPVTPVTPPVVVRPTIISQPAPFLGFDSYFDGAGELITAVQYGSAAWRVGLEPGDRVMAVDGVGLRYHGHGLQLLQNAAAVRGYVTLSVRDVHTGLVVNRTIGLGSSAVVVTHSSPGYVVRRNLTPSQILRRLPH